MRDSKYRMVEFNPPWRGFPIEPKHSYFEEATANQAVYEAHDKELELIGKFQLGQLSATEVATEIDGYWKKALSKIIQSRKVSP